MHPDCVGVPGRLSRRFRKWSLLCVLSVSSGVAFCQTTTNPNQIAESQKVQTAREANDRIAQLVVAASARQGDYIIGPGDLLGIEIFDVPELSRDVRVNETGFVAIPLIPVKVQAGGLTPFQFQDKLTELL